MTELIKSFMSNPQAVPYASIATLRAYTKDDIAKLGEATFDEVVQLTIIREKIYQESAHLSVSNEIIVTRAMDSLESQIFAPGDDAVRHTYPQPAESIAMTERAEPITYQLQKVDLQLGETRYFISDDAKLRGAADWLIADSASRAAEHMAADKDNHILSSLLTLSPAANDVTAGGPWDAASATPEDDLGKAVSNIIANSNISTAQLGKAQAFALVLPAAAFVGTTKLKLIRNITDTIGNFLSTQYKVKIVLSRKPRVESTWPILTNALVVPIQDKSIGFLGTWDGGGIIPAQERIRIGGRGEDIITKQWFKWTSIPEPLDGTTTTNSRVAEITGILT